MKTISNPQSIFGGRAFKVTALDLITYKPNPTDDGRALSTGMAENPFEGNGGGCFSVLSGKC